MSFPLISWFIQRRSVMNDIIFSPSIPIAPPELCVGHQEHHKMQPHGIHCIYDSCCPGYSLLITSQGPLMNPLGVSSYSSERLVCISVADTGHLPVPLFALTVQVKPDLHGPHLPIVHIFMVCILCLNFSLDFILSSLP